MTSSFSYTTDVHCMEIVIERSLSNTNGQKCHPRTLAPQKFWNYISEQIRKGIVVGHQLCMIKKHTLNYIFKIDICQVK